MPTYYSHSQLWFPRRPNQICPDWPALPITPMSKYTPPGSSMARVCRRERNCKPWPMSTSEREFPSVATHGATTEAGQCLSRSDYWWLFSDYALRNFAGEVILQLDQKPFVSSSCGATDECRDACTFCAGIIDLPCSSVWNSR